MHSADIEQLVETLAARLDRALSLEDLDGVLLAYSRDQPLADRAYPFARLLPEGRCLRRHDTLMRP